MMRSLNRRGAVIAVLALALAALPAAATLSPAQAATYCEYFYGPTPSAEVDTNNDGNPEVRVQSLSDVSVCAQADVFVHGNPIRLEQCQERDPRCWRILVHLQAGVTIDSGLTVCRELDDQRVCSYVDQTPGTIMTPPMDTLCIGVDLTGGRPCVGGTAMVGFE